MGKRPLLLLINKCMRRSTANFSTSIRNNKSYKLVVVGGGTGGCAVASKFSSKLGNGNVAIIEPNETHYYQPMWTMVGGGMKTLEESARPMKNVLPSKADWIQQRVTKFVPLENKVITEKGEEISYEFLVIAMGLQLKYEQIEGLPEAFESSSSLCSNYSPLYVNKTWKAIKEFRGGNALFYSPPVPIKCAGAPQKIMYIFDDYLRKNNIREKSTITFMGGLGVLFSSKYYADALWKLISDRGINVNLRQKLIKVIPGTNEAVFQNLDKTEEVTSVKYDFLHVTPPMFAPDILRSSTLVDSAGYLNVNKETLQHSEHDNIFGIGDCTNLPTSKTAAAVAGQFGILRRNLSARMDGKKLSAIYNGYTSCPIVTGYSKAIMAEFDYSTNALETFPYDQRKERRLSFHLKKDMMPFLYWNLMLKGHWEGPHLIRKLMHLGMK